MCGHLCVCEKGLWWGGQWGAAAAHHAVAINVADLAGWRERQHRLDDGVAADERGEFGVHHLHLVHVLRHELRVQLVRDGLRLLGGGRLPQVEGLCAAPPARPLALGPTAVTSARRPSSRDCARAQALPVAYAKVTARHE